MCETWCYELGASGDYDDKGEWHDLVLWLGEVIPKTPPPGFCHRDAVPASQYSYILRSTAVPRVSQNASL